MNRYAVARTVLNIYSNLENICNKIDKEVNQSTRILAEASNAYFGTLLKTFDSISDVIYRKSMLVNLKIYLEQALNKLPCELSAILYLKYMDRFSIKQISVVTENSFKNTERKLMLATKKFSNYLIDVGLTDEKFASVLTSESWIRKIYLYFCGVKKELSPCCCEIKITNGIITNNSINALTKKEFRCL